MIFNGIICFIHFSSPSILKKNILFDKTWLYNGTDPIILKVSVILSHVVSMEWPIFLYFKGIQVKKNLIYDASQVIKLCFYLCKQCRL